jgi:ribosomal protein S17
MKKLKGTVISLKNKNTAVVEVNTLKVHKKYKKVEKITKKFQVHYDSASINLVINEKVVIEHRRRFSATKSFLVVNSD